jgi:hypothetical protein
MIRTRIVEAVLKGPGQIEETDLGWTTLPEVPIEKKAPQPPKQGEIPTQPLTIKIDGTAFFIIGHTWDLKLSKPEAGAPMADSEATLVLVVQRVPPMPSGLVRAGADAMGQLERIMPPPGGSGAH